MPSPAIKTTSNIETFGLVQPDFVIESVLDPDHPDRLRLHTWDGRKATTAPTVNYRGCTYTPARIAGGLAGAVRFPSASRTFGSAVKLTDSMLAFLQRYAHLSPEVACLLVAFGLVSWFPDCIPVAPVLYLLGPDNEARLVLRLLGCFCRRPVLLGDVDLAALHTLPIGLDPTFLVGERNLPQRVARILRASNDRHFCIAHGNLRLRLFGARAFASGPETVDGTGVRVSLSPAQDPMPTLTDESRERNGERSSSENAAIPDGQSSSRL